MQLIFDILKVKDKYSGSDPQRSEPEMFMGVVDGL